MELKVIFYGGQQAGKTVLTTLVSKIQNIQVIPQDELVATTAEKFGLKKISLEDIKDFDLFICCHGRKIIPKEILNKGLCINLHPCLYKYKGAKPIKRMLEDGCTKASVGCHIMTEKVDEGEVIYEKFKEVKGKNEIEVYNELYPVYSEVILKSLEIINKKWIKKRQK